MCVSVESWWGFAAGGGGGILRGGEGASMEANIFSGLLQYSENTLLMLMCIRSEPGKY